MLLNKEGVSPIISVILLLLLSIIGVIGVLNLTQDYTESQIEGTNMPQGSQFRVADNDENFVLVNNPFKNLSISSIQIQNSSCTFNETERFESGIIRLNLSECIFKSSVIRPTITFFTERGIFKDTLRVRAISENSCQTTAGAIVRNFESKRLYSNSTVPAGEDCNSYSQIRSCNNGNLSGGESFIYSKCSAADQDITPDAFSFTNVTNVSISTIINSENVTVTGFDGPLSVEIIGEGVPDLRVNGGNWTNLAQVNDGDTLQIRLRSSSLVNSTYGAEVSLGDYSTNWSVTTRGYSLPENFISGIFGFDEALSLADTYIFNNLVNFTAGIFPSQINVTQDIFIENDLIGDRLISRNDSSYELDLNNNSTLAEVFANTFYTRGEGSFYYLRPAQTSRINNLTIDGGNVINNCQEFSSVNYSTLTCSSDTYPTRMEFNGTQWTQMCCYANN